MSINERLARALGYSHKAVKRVGEDLWTIEYPDPRDWACSDSDHDCEDGHNLPDYEHSMDALVRDVVPMLRERGLGMAVETVANVHAPWHADVFIRTFGDGHAAVTENVSCVTASTPAAALSEAAAIALEAELP